MTCRLDFHSWGILGVSGVNDKQWTTFKWWWQENITYIKWRKYQGNYTSNSETFLKKIFKIDESKEEIIRLFIS